MDEKEFVGNLEEIIFECSEITLNFVKEEVNNEEIILEFYNMISSKFCNKYDMSKKEFNKHYIDSAISGSLFGYLNNKSD